MPVSTAFITDAFAQETDEAFFALLKIDHDDLASPIRVVNNNEDIISNGQTFQAFPFKLILPDSKADSPTTSQLVIDNVDTSIVQALRTISSAPTVVIEIVRSSDVDTIEITYAPFTLRNVTWDVLSVSADLVFEDMDSEPFPAGVFSPAWFPAVF